MNKLVLSVALTCIVAGLIIFACNKSGGTGYNQNNNNNNNQSTSNKVTIANMSFSASSITVKAGTTVTWTNNDNVAHTVTANDNSFDSGNIAAGGTYSKTFSATGTYDYHCTIHSMMTGKVIVN